MSVLTIRKSEAISNAEFAFSALRSPKVLAKSPEVSRIRTRGKTIAYENRTKSAQSGGLETNGRGERISGSPPERRSAEVCLEKSANTGVLRRL